MRAALVALMVAPAIAHSQPAITSSFCERLCDQKALELRQGKLLGPREKTFVSRCPSTLLDLLQSDNYPTAAPYSTDRETPKDTSRAASVREDEDKQMQACMERFPPAKEKK